MTGLHARNDAQLRGALDVYVRENLRVLHAEPVIHRRHRIERLLVRVKHYAIATIDDGKS